MLHINHKKELLGSLWVIRSYFCPWGHYFVFYKSSFVFVLFLFLLFMHNVHSFHFICKKRNEIGTKDSLRMKRSEHKG